METTLTIMDADGRESTVTVEPGQTLARAVFARSGVAARPLCSGLGRCGMCRVRVTQGAPEPVDADLDRLGPERVAQGWRLACRHEAAPGMVLELPPAPSRPEVRMEPGAAAATSLALAVDLGTTSLHWSAWDGPALAARGQELNPQLGLGSEVMSRLAHAERGDRELLTGLVVDRLRAILSNLPAPVSGMCLAGNPAMVHILLGLDVSGLARAPYALAWRGGEHEPLAPGLPPLYVPPLVSPFVGADLSAGLAWVLHGGGEPRFPLLLADMGTNGEFLLALGPDHWLAASVALGPALEGVGLTFGGTAEPGAITGFELSPAGLVPKILDNARPTNTVTGTGYLSLVHALLRAGLLQGDGRFVRDNPPPLAAKLAARLARERGGTRFVFQDAAEGREALYVTGTDVETLLKVKAAFNAAWSRLMSEAGMTASDLRAVHLAGAMGEHARVADLEGLGFLPQGLGSAVVKAGNTSLKGAELLLARPELRPALAEAAGKSKVLDLAGDAAFSHDFIERMVFAHVP